MKSPLGVIAAFALALTAARPAAADPHVWRVAGSNGAVYIVGSTPSAPADGRWKTPALEHAAASASEVWFTTPFGLPDPFTGLRMLATIEAHGRLPDDQRLSALLSPDGRARLARLAARDGVPFDKIDRMTPWNAQITLGLAARRQDGSIKYGTPVERYVLDTAERNAPRHGMDNLERDLKVLIATPRKDQIYDLEEAMKRYEDPALNRRYGEAWAAGDDAWIERERDAPLRANAPATYQMLQIEPRNRWADQVMALARSGKTVIVLIDAANLVGPDSLIAMLRRKGAVVEEAPVSVAGGPARKLQP